MKINRAFATIALAAAAFVCVGAPSVNAASFNCNTADKPDEVIICQSPVLSGLDTQMSNLYFKLRNRLKGGARSQLLSDQSAWLRGRMGCGRDFNCIKAAYDRRISELQRNY